jgi:site-specific DNA recombinase
MKTKSELNDLPAKSSESWRSIKKGEIPQARSKRLENIPQFKIGGYIRLSPTAEERAEGSLVSHPQRIKQFVEGKNYQQGGGWGEIIGWYEDKDLSGKNTNRPELQRLLRDITEGIINAVVVTELSRLTRYTKDFYDLWEFFKQNKVAFFSLKESFDTSTPMGELMLCQAIGFAQFERQTIVDRIKKGARARAERGLANGYIPLGFKAVENRPNYRDIDKNEQPYVEMIFRKFLELKKLNHLIHYLNDNGHRTKEFTTRKGQKSGGHRWTLSSIYNVLTNRAYIGEREINKRFRSADQDELKDDERYLLVEAHWAPLISRELFFDVQQLLEQNKKKARKYVHEYRLTGLVCCADCGAQMVGKSGKGKNGKYFYYGHKRKMITGNDRHLHRCPMENVPAPLLEESIVSRLKDLSNDRDLVTELAKASSSESKSRIDHQKSLIAAKEQERRRLEQKLDNIYDSISESDDKDLRSGLTVKAKEIKFQLEQATTALVSMKAEYERVANVVDVSEAFEYIKIFKNGAFDAQPVTVQAEILKNRVRRIVVKEDGVYVEIYGRKPELVIKSLGQNEGIKKPAVLGSSRSGVRTVFNLVGVAGFEPTTFSTPKAFIIGMNSSLSLKTLTNSVISLYCVYR